MLVCEYTADKAGAVSFEVTLTRPSGATVTATSDRLRLTGRAAAENGEFPGTSFQMTVTARTEGGSVEVVGDRLLVSGAESATLLVSAATDYNFEDPKTPQTQDLSEACDEALALVNAMDMNTLRQRHVDDFKALYEASALRLTATTSSLPINERGMRASEGTADSGLLLLYFAYARYVFISASRYGGLPMNLQGLRNPLMQAPWLPHPPRKRLLLDRLVGARPEDRSARFPGPPPRQKTSTSCRVGRKLASSWAPRTTRKSPGGP